MSFLQGWPKFEVTPLAV